MRVRLWGTRGSIAAAGPETVRYGGDTSSIELRTISGRLIILDAGSGIRPLGQRLHTERRIDVLLSHLHMDHVQGLPFFGPLLDPEVEVHVWGPISTTRTLRARISRYLSPPLFPIRVRELSNVVFHDVPPSTFDIDGLTVTADLILHPGATLGYRLTEEGKTLAYLPDHEPALGDPNLVHGPEWTSGLALATGADVLVHDAQYTDQEYEAKVGWGHSATSHLARFAEMAEAQRLVTFHHDPARADSQLDELHADLNDKLHGVEMVPGTSQMSIDV